MATIEQLTSSELYKSAIALKLCTEYKIPREIEDNIVGQCTNNMSGENCLYFKHTDMQKLEDINIYRDIYAPVIEVELLNALVDISGIYNSVAHSENIPNIDNFTGTIDEICEYFKKNQSLISDKSSLNFETIVKRQLILQTVQNSIYNGTECISTLINYIKFLGVDNDNILFYPMKNGRCIFDLFTLTPSTQEEFVKKLGRSTFVNYLTTESIINNSLYDHRIPLLKYCHMFGPYDTTYASKRQAIMNVINTFIVDSSELKGIVLNICEHRVLANFIAETDYDIEILGKLKPLITETTLAMMLSNNTINIVDKVRIYNKFKQLEFPVDNMIHFLNVELDIMLDYQGLMEHAGTRNTLGKLEHDIVSVIVSINDRNNYRVFDLVSENSIIMSDNLDNYINIKSGDDIYRIKKLDVFTSPRSLACYIEKVISSRNEEGLDLIKSNLDNIIENFEYCFENPKHWLDTRGNSDDYLMCEIWGRVMGALLIELKAGASYYNKFLENDRFIAGLLYYHQIGNPSQYILDMLECNELSFKSKITLHILKLKLKLKCERDGDGELELLRSGASLKLKFKCKCEPQIFHSDASLGVHNYEKIAQYYFNISLIDDGDLEDLKKCCDVSKLEDMINMIGEYMPANILKCIMIIDYDLFIRLVPYLKIPKHVLINNLEDYIIRDISDVYRTNQSNISFKIVDKMLECNLLGKNDIIDYVTNLKQYNIDSVFYIVHTLDTIEYTVPLIDIFKSIINSWVNTKPLYEHCITLLSKRMDTKDIVTVISAIEPLKLKKYWLLINKISDKHLSYDIYLNLFATENLAHSMFRVNGPIDMLCDTNVEFIDGMFSIESKSDNYCALVTQLIKRYLNTTSGGSLAGSVPITKLIGLYKSTQFTNRISDQLLICFNDNRESSKKLYDYMIRIVTYDPESFGKSNIFHKEYWNTINGGQKNICIFFKNLMSVQYQASTNVLKKLQFIKEYFNTHGTPCEYAEVKTQITDMFARFISNDNIIKIVLDIVNKFNGLDDIVRDNTILSAIFKKTTLCKDLLGRMSHEQQAEILSSNVADFQLFIESDFPFFLDLVDRFGISSEIDINNVGVMNGLYSLDPKRVYELYKHGFIKCDLLSLIIKINDILDIDDVLLNNDIIDAVFNMDYEDKIIIKILKNLHKNKSDRYDVLFNSTVKNYIGSNPFGLSGFITNIGGNIHDIMSDSEISDKIYELCKYDPSLYGMIFKSTEKVDDKLINIRTLGGDLMISCFKNDDTIMRKVLPGISREFFFTKNRIGKYVIESLLTPENINIMKERNDGAIIMENIVKYNIGGYGNITGIDKLLEMSSTSSNNFMFLCRTLTSTELFKLISDLPIEDINRILISADDRLNNGLFYLTRYHSEILEHYINNIDDEIFKSANSFGETLGMYAMRYNIASYEILEEANKITKEHNYIDIYTGSLLSYTIKYNENKFEHIINSPYFNEYSIYVKDYVKMIDFNDEDMTRVNTQVNIINIIVAMENVEAFQLFMKLFPQVFNKHINEKFKISQTDYNTLRYALCVDPEIASVIIGSNACTEMYLETFCSYFPERNFSSIADVQPASWYKIINSDRFKHIKPQQSNEYHYSKKTNIGYIVEHSTNNNKKLIQCKQSFNFTSKNVCKICLVAKATILHSMCGHRMCVGCSLIENTCPFCNIKTPDENQYYID